MSLALMRDPTWAAYHPPRRLSSPERRRLAGMVTRYSDAAEIRSGFLAPGGSALVHTVGYHAAAADFEDVLEELLNNAERHTMRRHLLVEILTLTGAPPTDLEGDTDADCA